MEPGRTFNEKEAAEILRRAAQLQGASSGENAEGVSYENLRRIAAEAGIGESFLLSAIRSPSSKKTRFFNLIEEHERVVDGSVSTDDLDEINETIARHGRLVQVGPLGRSVQGQVTKGVFVGAVEVSSMKDRGIRIRVQNSLQVPYFAGLHMPLILAIAIAPLFLGLEGIKFHDGPWIAAGICLLLLAVGAILFTQFARVGVKRAKALADDLEATVSSLVKKPTLPTVRSAAADVRPLLNEGLNP
jgi:hypothetical protein